MSKKEIIVLPPKYYLDYFTFLLEFVQSKSGHLLGNVGETFISDFSKLSEDAKCLLVRFANRKGAYFRLSKIKYEEISNVGLAAEELIENEFASLDLPNDPRLFRLFTKAELAKIFPERELEKKKKDKFLPELAEEAQLVNYQKLAAFDTVIHTLRLEEIDFLKLLFFGHNHGMMTEFVIRDIGNVKLENLDDHDFTPWFDSHEEALAVFELSKLNSLIKEYMSIALPEELLEAIAPINWSSMINFKNARKSGDRIMLRLGAYFEKAGFPEEALSYFALAKKHPCRERQIRIYQKLDRSDDALDLAEAVYENPYNATEKIFAKDFIAKVGKRNLRSTTNRIKLSDEITVSSSGSQRVEDKALDYLREMGYDGIHAENHLWRSIFGLLFWEELFDSSQTAFHHPLQRAPSDLYSSAFYETRKDVLNQKLRTLSTKKKLLDKLIFTHTEKQGINNPLVGWSDSLISVIEVCIRLLPLSGIKKVMIEVAKNVKDNSTGFPDLFIWTETKYQFYEVKSPNDYLSSQQLFWLDFFKEHKIKSEILRVHYS
ncbi:MAG: VRR-NUC domain-containing protein [Cyclobacteriaceae bacterium]